MKGRTVNRTRPSLILCLASMLFVAGQPPKAATETRASLQLLELKYLPGSFLGDKSVFADKDNIYVASYEGILFVLARDKTAHFPLLEMLRVSAIPLTAVRGNKQNIYVTSADGMLTVYGKRPDHSLAFVEQRPLSGFGLSSVAVVGQTTYVGRGQASMDANRQVLFLSQLNQEDTVSEIEKRENLFGETFVAEKTIVFDTRSGQSVADIQNPSDVFGRMGQVALYATDSMLIQTMPGCCGTGIYLYDAKTFRLRERIPRFFANAVSAVPRSTWLIAGGEDGRVDLYDIGKTPALQLASADLRQLTGHLGSEDIEIRAVWSDGEDHFVFAASSWGNDRTRGSSLPSFFILERENRNSTGQAEPAGERMPAGFYHGEGVGNPGGGNPGNPGGPNAGAPGGGNPGNPGGGQGGAPVNPGPPEHSSQGIKR